MRQVFAALGFILLGLFPGAALAQPCEAGKPEMVQAGLDYRDYAAKMQEIEVEAADAQAALDALMYDVEETGGPEDWQARADEWVRVLSIHSADWEVAYGMMLSAGDALKAAMAAHETACGANAQTAGILQSLGLTPTH